MLIDLIYGISHASICRHSNNTTIKMILLALMYQLLTHIDFILSNNVHILHKGVFSDIFFYVFSGQIFLHFDFLNLNATMQMHVIMFCSFNRLLVIILTQKATLTFLYKFLWEFLRNLTAQ